MVHEGHATDVSLIMKEISLKLSEYKPMPKCFEDKKRKCSNNPYSQDFYTVISLP